MMTELHERWAFKLTVKLYVDDLKPASYDQPRELIAFMVEVINFVADWLEHVLLMEVSAKKSQISAGRTATAKALVIVIEKRQIP